MAMSTHHDPYVDELEARIERLEKALRLLLDAKESEIGCCGIHGHQRECAVVTAREALEGEK